MSIIQEALKKAQVATKPQMTDTPHLPARDLDATQGHLETKGAAPNRAAGAVTPRSASLAILLFVIVVIFASITAKSFLAGAGRSAAKTTSASQKILYSNKQGPAEAKSFTAGPDLLGQSANGSEKMPNEFGLGILKPLNEPYEERSNANSKYLLNGIMYLEGGSRAIINNTTVNEGDVIDGATVKKIEEDDVILDRDGREITLRVM